MATLEIRPIQKQDISNIMDMQARVWQDHFLKERNQQVPMMRRSLQNMEYYISKEPDGCFVAIRNNHIVGSIISHVWGSVGWFGPLEVEATAQGQGVGKALVDESVRYLQSMDCGTIGCETMAGSPKNMAFYNKLGFKARGLSNVLYKRLAPGDPERLGQNPAARFEGGELGKARNLWANIQPGLDYEKELNSVKAHALGECWALEDGSHAIVHTYEMFSDSPNAILKLMAAPAGSAGSIDILLERCEMSAVMAGKTGMFIRTYDPTPPEMSWFFKNGYILQSNSVRLILQGPDEAGEDYHISCWSG